MASTVLIGFKIEPHIKTWIKAEAMKQNRSVSGYLRHLISTQQVLAMIEDSKVEMETKNKGSN